MTLKVVAPGINRLRNRGEWCSGDISCCATNRNTGTELWQDREPPSDGKPISGATTADPLRALRTKASQHINSVYLIAAQQKPESPFSCQLCLIRNFS